MRKGHPVHHSKVARLCDLDHDLSFSSLNEIYPLVIGYLRRLVLLVCFSKLVLGDNSMLSKPGYAPDSKSNPALTTKSNTIRACIPRTTKWKLVELKLVVHVQT